MDTQTWLPIVTLLLGGAVGLGGERWREARSTTRERETRRKDFQRNAILEAQDLLAKHIQLGSAKLSDAGRRHKETGNWPEEGQIDPDNASSRIETSIKLVAVGSRIEDEDLRVSLGITVDRMVWVGVEGAEQSEAFFRAAIEAQKSFHGRAREVLAELH